MVAFMGRDVTVYFHSDVFVEAKGFKANYEVLFEGKNKFAYCFQSL